MFFGKSGKRLLSFTTLPEHYSHKVIVRTRDRHCVSCSVLMKEQNCVDLVHLSTGCIQESGTAVVECNWDVTGMQLGLTLKPVGLTTSCLDLVHNASQLQDDSISASTLLCEVV